MPVTTTEQEYKRLRSYLSPFIKGKNTDAILQALAAGPSSYLINNVAAVNDNMYIATAVGTYLDQRLAESGITRPPSVGLSDDIFRQIGIEVKNRKQVRDLIHNILQSIFGDEFVRANNPARAVEPYHLVDGMTLIVNFDENHTAVIPFQASEFENIASATAQEVADAITKTISQLGVSGSAIAKNDGNGAYVEILSDTIGPKSSVTVMGGAAENVLLFDAPISAGGNATTQWTVTLSNNGNIRYTWTGGANPNVAFLEPGNYANIYGGGFTGTLNEGTYTVTSILGGGVDVSYFEVQNPTGIPGIFTQGVDDAILFYNPVRRSLASLESYVSVYQTQSRVLQIFLPPSTRVIRRGRLGSAHLHFPQTGSYYFKAQPATNDVFQVTTTNALVAGVDFAIGATISDTIVNFVAAINAISGIVANFDGTNQAFIQSDTQSQNIVATYSGSANIQVETEGDPASTAPNQPGPYGYDLGQPFVVSATATTTTQVINGASQKIISVKDSTKFPDTNGYLILGYGTQQQEGPIPYTARPSDNSLLISPAYTFTNQHPDGEDVSLVASKSAPVPSPTGTDYQFFVTDVVSGRLYAQDLINQVAAIGLNIIFTVLYPSDIGLSKAGTAYTENPYIWGS